MTYRERLAKGFRAGHIVPRPGYEGSWHAEQPKPQILCVLVPLEVKPGVFYEWATPMIVVDQLLAILEGHR